VRELDLHVTPRTADFACGTLAAQILAPDPVGRLLFAFHCPSWKLDIEYERGLQGVAAARLEEACGHPSPHVVLAGDLDADPNAASVRFWAGRRALDGVSVCYRDVWESAQRICVEQVSGE